MKDSTIRKVGKVDVQVLKTDAKLGLVFGFAIVCKTKNADGEYEDYYDDGSFDATDDTVYSDHITEQAMIEGVTEFMKSQRVATEDHERDDDDEPVQKGMVVHSFPLTEAIAKSLGIDTEKTGWLVAMEPDPEVFKRFEAGELTQFSIGGRVHREKEAA
jgi:hypothetical protein